MYVFICSINHLVLVTDVQCSILEHDEHVWGWYSHEHICPAIEPTMRLDDFLYYNT